MRCFVNVVAKGLTVLPLSFYVLLMACKGNYMPITQPDPLSETQAYVISEMKRFETSLDIGEFIVTFVDPPAPNYAGWTRCYTAGDKPPWFIHINKGWIDMLTLDGTVPGRGSMTGRTYLSALTAHEMCHVWAGMQKHVSCYDEVAAETCATNLVAIGSPE